MARRNTRRTEIPNPKTFVEYLTSKVHDFQIENTDVTLGTLTDGIWQEYTRGESWNCVRVGSVWEPKFITIESIEREHRFYLEQFENRLDKILGY